MEICFRLRARPIEAQLIFADSTFSWLRGGGGRNCITMLIQAGPVDPSITFQNDDFTLMRNWSNEMIQSVWPEGTWP